MQLEDYLRNRPVAPSENAKGEKASTAAPLPMPARGGAKKTELDDDDREWLKRLVVEPGWSVLMRLLDSNIARREQAAVTLSQVDPVKNKDEIVTAWTYVGAMKETKVSILGLIQVEIDKLRSDDDAFLGE
jgi:hypothetical protein